MFWFNDLNCADMVPNVLTGMGCNPLGYNFHEMFGLMSSHVDGFVFNDTAGVRVTKPSPCFFYQTRGYFWLQQHTQVYILYDYVYVYIYIYTFSIIYMYIYIGVYVYIYIYFINVNM